MALTKEFQKNQTIFNLTIYDAKLDPAEAMLCQNHVQAVKGFLGQTTAFNKAYIKPGVLIMGENNDSTEAKYIHGVYGNGSWTWYPGHVPDDNQQLLGYSSTNLDKYPISPGFRLFLNNVFFRGSEVPVSENTETAIRIYPNPTGNYVNVTGQIANSHYLIFDETGKIMQSGTLNEGNAQLDIAQFPNGVYLLQVNGNTLKIFEMGSRPPALIPLATGHYPLSYIFAAMESKHFCIFGRIPVIEAFKAGKRFDKILLLKNITSDEITGNPTPRQEHETPVQNVPKEKLEDVAKKYSRHREANHQGVIGFLSMIDYYSLDDVLHNIYAKGETPLLLVLDHITDVGNFGAIARSAECTGHYTCAHHSFPGLSANKRRSHENQRRGLK